MTQSNNEPHTDASISALYKRTQTESSSPELDQRIMDYAHQAIAADDNGTQGKKSWFQEMGFPLAMAASVVVGLLFFRTFVSPNQDVPTPGYLSQSDTYLTTPVTTDKQPNRIPGVNQTDTRLADKDNDPKVAPPAQKQPVQQNVASAKKTVKPIKAVKQNPKTVFAKKSVSDNPLVAPVNKTIGEPDMETWYEDIARLFSDGKDTEGKKALSKFIKKYPRHEAALKLQKSLDK